MDSNVITTQRLSSEGSRNRNSNHRANCNRNEISKNVKMQATRQKAEAKFSCDRQATRGKFQVITLLLLLPVLVSSQLHRVSPGKLEFQLVGQAGESAQLPCLIGRQVFCGEPYFIVWYKSNSSSSSGKPNWTRLEHKSSPSEEFASTGNELNLAAEENQLQLVRNNPQRFLWSRQSTCELALQSVDSGKVNLKQVAANFDCARLTISQLELADEALYKCDVTYTESLDYDKCPASSESQLSVIARPNEPELLVNGRLLAPSSSGGFGSRQQPMTSNFQQTFKEGAQVRLECQSSGGRPAPRIEWLNVSLPLPVENSAASNSSSGLLPVEPSDVQLLRALWPHKKSQPATSGSAASELPITSSSVTIQLSRYDLQSNFVCLLLNQQHFQSQQAAELAQHAQQQLIRNPLYLASLLNQAPSGSAGPGRNLAQAATNAQLKWLKLNVQVKPSGASVRVLDAESGRQLEESLPSNFLPPSEPFYSLKVNKLYAVQCIVDNSRPRSLVSWFNRTLPIQLEQIELNSTSRLDYPEMRLLKTILQTNSNGRRMASFTRTHANANGTFRTVASLLLTTSIWDNFEELFCRVSNEAFQFDELMQVAPIMPVRLYVNYAPFGWLEPVPRGRGEESSLTMANEGRRNAETTTNAHYEQPEAAGQPTETVRLEANWEFQLRCFIAANPLSQNSILQIDWFKDGRRLSGSANSTTSPRESFSPPSSGRRIYIEKTNHLHMTSQQASSSGEASHHHQLTGGGKTKQQLSPGASQLVASSKLMAASLLTIKSSQPSDSGLYSCQFKLIPTPGSGASPNFSQQQQQQRALQGQANNTIRLEVAEGANLSSRESIKLERYSIPITLGPLQSSPERLIESCFPPFQLPTTIKPPQPPPAPAKVRGPLIRVLGHSAELIVYSPALETAGSETPPDGAPTKLLTLVGPPNCQISLRCDLVTLSNNNQLPATNHKVSWFLEGHFLHSSEPGEMLNLTLAADSPATSGGAISCAHQLASSAKENLLRVYHSSEQLSLRLLVEPRLMASTNRKELMPSLRSFSKLELEANSARKLRLTCLAQCEPLCAIEWYLGTEPPGGAAVTGSRRLGPPTGSPLELMANRSSNLVYFAKTFLDDQLLGSLAQVDNLLRLNQNNSLRWLTQSKLGQTTGSGSGAALASEQLQLELAEFVSEPSASVVSRLELSYDQISQLLIGRQLEEISLECRTVRRGQANNSRLVKPGRWFSPLEELFSSAQMESLVESSPKSPDKGGLKWPLAQQTKILLDKPPRNVAISFGNVLSTDDRPTSVALSEGQLLELSDPSEKVSPKLNCQTSAFPRPQFKWTFTDLNGSVQALSEEESAGEEGEKSSLNLRKFIDFRQRQLQVAPSAAYGVEVVASIVGNYTCTSSNLYGSRSASLALRVQGRPLCKLSLGREFLGPEKELMASLRCSIYSQPPLTELIWFRNNQQLPSSTNTKLAELSNISQPLSVWELPVMVLNKQQNFMLADLANEAQANFKCVARNLLGFSEACELSPSDKQLLTNIASPLSNLARNSMFPLQATGGQQLLNFRSSATFNGSSSDQFAAGNGNSSPLISSLLRLLANKLDWLAAIAFSLVLVWILFLFATKRTKYSPKRKLTSLSRLNHETSWRFTGNTMDSVNGFKLSAGATTGTLVQVPCFQASNNQLGKKLTGPASNSGNYYGNFGAGQQADSEVDMMQSACSQSTSNYDDFVQHQLQQRLPITIERSVIYGTYNQSTLNNPTATSSRNHPFKSSSLSGSSSTGGDSSIGSGGGKRQHQLIRLNETGNYSASQRGNAREFAGTMLQLASGQPGISRQTGQYAPLVNGSGSHNSRINLEQQARFCSGGGQLPAPLPPPPPPAAGLQRNSLLLGGGEPIYDDVIYNQMIL